MKAKERSRNIVQHSIFHKDVTTYTFGKTQYTKEACIHFPRETTFVTS